MAQDALKYNVTGAQRGRGYFDATQDFMKNFS